MHKPLTPLVYPDFTQEIGFASAHLMARARGPAR